MNQEFKRMQELAGLTEIRVNKPGLSDPASFKYYLDRIPYEKYFNEYFNGGYDPWGDTIDDWESSDLVDEFYDPIFNNELKGKPGIEGDNFWEWMEIDREKNPAPYESGARESMLASKIHNAIISYKKKHFSNKT
jgi:hypothetical protein